MSVIGSNILAGASGAAGGGDKVYVDDVFSTFLYEGTNTSTKTITNGLDLGGEGGLVWIKGRNNTNSHFLFDTERGATKALRTDRDNATHTSNSLTSFTSTGFVLGDSGNTGWSGDFVSWSFRKAPGFFDVVTYTGNGTNGRTISHDLGSVPGMIICKRTDGSGHWYVYHRSLANTQYLMLNVTNGVDTGLMWNNTTPTSTQITLGGGQPNDVNQNYVAYIFAHDDAQFGTDEDESIIKCGTYAGDGSTNDTKKITLGFEPQLVLIKRTNTSGSWYLHDNMRGIASGGYDPYVLANSQNSETTDKNVINLHPDGFSVIAGEGHNGNGSSYIYMAIRRPNKPPEAATDVFDASFPTSVAPQHYVTGFPVDLNINGITNGSDKWYASARLTGNAYMNTTSNAAAVTTSSSFQYDFNTGVMGGWPTNYVGYSFRRAPGFMDVVAYTGTVTGSSDSQTVPHNLGVTPELMLVKRRSGGADWYVYSNALTTPLTQKLVLNSSDGESSTSNAWGTSSSPTAPNANNFTVGYATNTGWVTAGTFIAHLFATLPGISKVGSYSGNTSNAVDVDCGFTAGARFILIKRTDSTGDWYVWDTTRGIVSGNDPYLLLNSTAAQVTNTDYIDPNVYGFTVTATAPAALNATGGTYLFLAIA